MTDLSLPLTRFFLADCSGFRRYARFQYHRIAAKQERIFYQRRKTYHPREDYLYNLSWRL